MLSDGLPLDQRSILCALRSATIKLGFGFDGWSLPERAGHSTAYGMRLPSGCLAHLGNSRTIGPHQQRFELIEPGWLLRFHFHLEDTSGIDPGNFLCSGLVRFDHY